MINRTVGEYISLKRHLLDVKQPEPLKANDSKTERKINAVRQVNSPGAESPRRPTWRPVGAPSVADVQLFLCFVWFRFPGLLNSNELQLRACLLTRNSSFIKRITSFQVATGSSPVRTGRARWRPARAALCQTPPLYRHDPSCLFEGKGDIRLLCLTSCLSASLLG